jgi:hypothetical protein
VANAEKIVVKLVDDREFQAKVIGKDPNTDVHNRTGKRRWVNEDVER